MKEALQNIIAKDFISHLPEKKQQCELVKKRNQLLQPLIKIVIIITTAIYSYIIN